MTQSRDPTCKHDRVIRFVGPGTLPGADVLSIYDASQNLLLVDRELFDGLSVIEQRQVLRTHRGSIAVARA